MPRSPKASPDAPGGSGTAEWSNPCVESGLMEAPVGKKVSGFGTTLVQASVIVLVSVVLGVGISRFDFAERMPLIGPLLQEWPAGT